MSVGSQYQLIWSFKNTFLCRGLYFLIVVTSDLKFTTSAERIFKCS